MPELQIYLLGNFHLIYRDEPVLIPQARLQSLLAYLALHRNLPQSRQHLAFHFWPDSSEAHAHTNLRQLLYLLRKIWPAVSNFLQVDAKFLSWKDVGNLHCDVLEFEKTLAQAADAIDTAHVAEARAALEDAVALYGGELLPDSYEEWLLEERERLRQRLLEALEQLVVLCESLSDYPSAIHHANRLLRADPLRETTYQRLMRLYTFNGDRASALRTYHVCTTILARELGVAPNPETQAMYAHLFKLDIPVAPSAVPAQRSASRTRLVGRKAQWETLQAAWQMATQGPAHFVCIVGEAGIGKTRLADELLYWAQQQGIAQARTRAYAAEGSLAYAPISEWLRADLFQAVWKQLPALWLSEVARLRTELLVERLELPHPEPLSEDWQRQRFLEALARTILAAGQPLLLVIDDLQWCDQETLEWLHYLLRFDHQARLLVVGTLRPEEVEEHHPLTALLFDIGGSGQLTEIDLGPLTMAECDALATQVAERKLDGEMVHDLYRATEGNPFYLVETVRALETHGQAKWRAAQDSAATAPRTPQHPWLPAKVQAVIGRRLAQLSPTAREVASLAAVIGRSFVFPMLVRATGLAEEALVAGVDELWQRRIIREQGANAYDFSHDLIREMAYATISPARRPLLHRSVAHALEAIYGNSLETVCGQLAIHYEQAGLAEQAIAYYRQAVTAAYQVGAYTEMVAHLHKALSLLESLPETPEQIEQQVDVLLSLGDALVFVKGFTAPEVEEVYNQARDLCLRIDHVEKRFLALRGLRRYWAQRGRWPLAGELAEEMLSLAEEMQNPIYIQSVLRSAGSAHFHQGNFQEAHSLLAPSAISGPQRSTTNTSNYDFDPEVATLCGLANILWFLGYPVQAQVRMGEGLALAYNLGRPYDQLMANDFAFDLDRYLRQPQAAYARATEFITLATKHRFSHFATTEMLCRGWLLVEQGKPSEGIAVLRQVLEIRQQRDIVMFLPEYLSFLVEAYGRAKQWQQGLAVVADALKLAKSTGEQYWSVELYRLQGELMLAQGAADDETVDKVEDSYLQALELARQQNAKSLELRASLSLARLWQQQGRQAKARDLLAAIYGWFTEGFDTADLQAAQALLAELNHGL